MEENRKKYRYRKLLTSGLVILAIALFLILAFRALIQSDWFFDKIRDIAIDQVHEQINGHLEIEKIRGDLRHGFVIYDLKLSDSDSETVLRTDSIAVGYHWMSLIRPPYQIESLKLFGVHGYLNQEADSTWNVEKLMPDRDIPESPDRTNPMWDLKQIQISGLQLDLYSEYLLPDNRLSIREMEALMAAGYHESGFYGSISSLEFKLNEERLPQYIGIELSGMMDDGIVTLESLILDTGRSFLKASAELENRERLTADASFSPVSREDLLLYVENLPMRENLNLSVTAGGRLDDLNIQLNANAAGLELFEFSTNMSLNDGPIVRSIRMNVAHLNLPVLTGEEDWPVIESLSLTGDGRILTDGYEQSHWTGNIEITGLQIPGLQMDHYQSEFVWERENLNLDANFRYQDQNLRLSASVTKLFDEKPDWNLDLEGDHVNLAVWLDEPDMDSQFRFISKITGNGFSTDDFNIDADIQVTEGNFGDQKFERIEFLGNITPHLIAGGLTAQLDRSRLTTDVRISGWNDYPQFEFLVELHSFNLAELEGFEVFPTHVNGTLTGHGSGFDPQELELFAIAELDSSIVNGEIIDQFSASLRIENSYFYIDEGMIRSPIADASLTLRHHLSDFLDRENRFSFSADLKDLSVLAPLFGFETLEASGEINGRLTRNLDGILTFSGDSNLHNVMVDTLFSSEMVTANLHVLLIEQPETEFQIELVSPNIMDIEIQDLNLIAFAAISEEETRGNVNVRLTNGNESSLHHKGEFSYRPDDIRLLTTDLTFLTGQRTLMLTEPFELIYREEVLRSDTLTIATDDLESYLTLWIPHLDTLQQQVGLEASYLNLGVLQKTFMEESYFDGFLSGRIELNKSPEDLKISAKGYLREFGLESGEMDSLSFDLSLADEWLEAGLHSWHGGQLLMESSVRVPYLPGDPLTFEDQFFEREILGNLKLHESDLTYWLSFLPEGSPEQTGGRLSIQLDLTGIAGSPELTGNLNIAHGLFSGIRIDQLGINLDYQHSERETLLNGFIIRDQQRVMDFDTRVPFLVDLKRAEIILPSDEDEIFATLRTENFDLAMFNNYLDPNQIRNLAGRLEGNLNLSGQLADIQMNGNMNLTRGAMRIVPAGINLTEIRSDISFEPDRVRLQQFTMRSGPGTFRATGTVGMDGLQPGNIDIELVANQFRVANTSDYNAIVNSRARVTGDVENPRLTGSLTFLNGFLNLQNFGERSVETVVLDDEVETEPFPFFENLAMEMDVNFARQFFIRNRQYLDMEIELGGQVDLLKEKNEEIQMFGTLEGVRGYARPLGKNFELDQANLSFSGPVDNPQLNIITQHEPPQAAGVIIYYIIDGTLQSPNFRFDSTPELELQDIISYTLFGKPFYELESWEQVVAGSGSSPSAADYALDVLLDRVEMLASQRLGIDVVQIDNTRSGSSNTTSIKTGWYLNRRTFFAILNEVGGSRPKTLFLLEYLLTENLELIIMQGDDSREGIDLRWKRDY